MFHKLSPRICTDWRWLRESLVSHGFARRGGKGYGLIRKPNFSMRQKKIVKDIFHILDDFQRIYQFLFSSTLNHYQHCVDKDFYVEGEIHIFDIEDVIS